MKSREIGDIGEQTVCDYLHKNGYEIIKRNFTVKGGEIDIIAEKNDTVCFVEVKTRKLGALSSGEEALTSAKRKHIIYAAKRFLTTLAVVPKCRFDVAVVETKNEKVVKLKYYVNAFDTSR